MSARRSDPRLPGRGRARLRGPWPRPRRGRRTRSVERPAPPPATRSRRRRCRPAVDGGRPSSTPMCPWSLPSQRQGTIPAALSAAPMAAHGRRAGIGAMWHYPELVRSGAVGDAGGRPDTEPPALPLTQDAPEIYPRPLPEPSALALLRRSSTITRVVGRRFAPVALRQVRTIRQGALPGIQVARPLRRSFEDLGGTFMKFGQIIASSPGMFGDDVAEEFRACLDTGPEVPFPEVRQRVEEDLGRPLDVVFAEFGRDPIGTASIAVVHRARLHDGTLVAVKVLRPNIEQVVATDLDLMQPSDGDTGAPDRGPVGRLHVAAARWFPGPDRRGDGPAERGPLHGPLPSIAERVRPEDDRRARAVSGVLRPQRAHHGVLRRSAHRRPGARGRARHRPDPARPGGHARRSSSPPSGGAPSMATCMPAT